MMKRQIAAIMLALPLGTISLLPTSASAAETHSQFNNIERSPVIVAQRRAEVRYRNHRRVWVRGHWERGPRGHRRWVPGHWEYRR